MGRPRPRPAAERIPATGRPADMSDPTRDWWVYRGDGKPHDPNLPQAPPWRRFGGAPRAKFQIDDAEIDLVNAALLLRRPLLITGVPGVGKSSLIHAVAHELRLGEVLAWPINTRSKLQNGLYDYDAIGRFQEEQARGWDKPTPDDTEQAYERLGHYSISLQRGEHRPDLTTLLDASAATLREHSPHLPAVVFLY